MPIRRHSQLYPLVVALSTLACRPEPAPSEVDELARWLWVNFEHAADDQLIEAAQGLHDDLGATLDEQWRRTMAPLSPEEARVSGAAYEGDSTQATGLLSVNLVKCSLEAFEALLLRDDQEELLERFERYDRFWQTNREDFTSRRTPYMRWESSYTMKVSVPFVGSSTYDAATAGQARWIPASTVGAGIRGPVLLVRDFLLKEPTFHEETEDWFRQDHQIQLIYERSPGEVVHFFGAWRDARFFGMTTEHEIMSNVMLDQFRDAGRRFETLCND